VDCFANQVAKPRGFLDTGAGLRPHVDLDLPAIDAREEVLAEIRGKRERQQGEAEESRHHLAAVLQTQLQQAPVMSADRLEDLLKAALEAHQRIAAWLRRRRTGIFGRVVMIRMRLRLPGLAINHFLLLSCGIVSMHQRRPRSTAAASVECERSPIGTRIGVRRQCSTGRSLSFTEFQKARSRVSAATSSGVNAREPAGESAAASSRVLPSNAKVTLRILLETRHVRAAFKAMPVKTDCNDARGNRRLSPGVCTAASYSHRPRPNFRRDRGRPESRVVGPRSCGCWRRPEC
jgi:hypothetical protein